jgi:hypothetical protein
MLCEAWEIASPNNLELILAGGNMSLLLKKRVKGIHGLRILDGWLTEDEMESLISGAEFIILAYVEASQSGVIPIAHGFGVPVLVTKVGGLTEQIFEDKTGKSSHSSATELAVKIDEMNSRKLEFDRYSQAAEMVQGLISISKEELAKLSKPI